MFKIQTFLSALLLSQISASSLRPGATANQHHRDLSFEYFLSYEPLTNVNDHAAIDLDQQLIESLLAEGTDQANSEAFDVYKSGANSKSYAEITLTDGLPVDVPKGVMFKGKRSDGSEVIGTTMTDSSQGETVLQIQYYVSSIQETYVKCRVGANPDPMLEGCFANNGTIEAEEFGNFLYTYDMRENNFNARSIQLFSTEAKQKMFDCPNCPYDTYGKFEKYYSAFDYADRWVTAAFNRGETNFGRGKANFALYGRDGINEAIKKGTAYMNVWMYVIREMEDAYDDCIKGCDTAECNDDKVHAWDEAVAFYTGSIPKASGKGGVLPFTLAQKRCENFGTCLSAGDDAGMAYANAEIFKNFRIGKQNLMMNNCEAVRKQIDAITQHMTVPLVQGTIRYAHVQDKQGTKTEKAQAEGAVFAAAVLPLVHHCSAADADIIYSNMKVGNNGMANFKAVKEAFERQYECLGITCDHVGGLVDDVNGGFWEGAEPCGHIKAQNTIATSAPQGGTVSTTSATSNNNRSAPADDGPNVGLAVGLTIGIVAGLIIIALLISRKNQKEFDGAANAEMA